MSFPLGRRRALGLAAARATTTLLPARALAEVGRPEPFAVHVAQAKLDAIRKRVADYPWYPPLAGADGAPVGWRYGTDIGWLHDLARHWVDGYEWRDVEARYNAHPNFRVEIDGSRLHYIHEKGSGQHPQALLIVHGWPYSATSYLDLIERLAHPERFGGSVEDGFDVVVVSAPGTFFSEAPRTVETLRQHGERYHRLMTQVLGYRRYLVHAGDQGAISAVAMSLDHPDAVAGIQPHLLFPRQPEAPFGSGQVGAPDARPEETAFVLAEQAMVEAQMGYFKAHAGRGETLSVAMMDSPVGVASWIAEKFRYWTDTRERPFEQAVSRDQILDEVMTYLVTDSFRTSIWPYMGFQIEPPALAPGQKITAPVAVQQWSGDGIHPVRPRSFVERSMTHIVQWTVEPRGGHFPSYEQPDALVADIRSFGRAVRAAQ